MAASFPKRRMVRLRVQICVQDEHAQYLGWPHAGGVIELPDPHKAFEFVQLFDTTVAELCKELGYTFRKTESRHAPNEGQASTNTG